MYSWVALLVQFSGRRCSTATTQYVGLCRNRSRSPLCPIARRQSTSVRLDGSPPRLICQLTIDPGLQDTVSRLCRVCKRRGVAHSSRIEQHKVGVGALTDHPTINYSEHFSSPSCHLVHGRLHAEQTDLPPATRYPSHGPLRLRGGAWHDAKRIRGAAAFRIHVGATPLLDPAQRKTSIVVKGEPPAPIDPPSGCMFASRCPYATELCVAERPMLRQVAGTRVGCHHVEAIC